MPRRILEYRVLETATGCSDVRVRACDLVTDNGALYAVTQAAKTELLRPAGEWVCAHAVDDGLDLGAEYVWRPGEGGGVHWGTSGCMVACHGAREIAGVESHPCTEAQADEDGTLVVRGRWIAQNGRAMPITRALYASGCWRHAMRCGEEEALLNRTGRVKADDARLLAAEAAGLYGAMREGGYEPGAQRFDGEEQAVRAAQAAGVDWSTLPGLSALADPLCSARLWRAAEGRRADEIALAAAAAAGAGRKALRESARQYVGGATKEIGNETRALARAQGRWMVTRWVIEDVTSASEGTTSPGEVLQHEGRALAMQKYRMHRRQGRGAPERDALFERRAGALLTRWSTGAIRPDAPKAAVIDDVVGQAAALTDAWAASETDPEARAGARRRLHKIREARKRGDVKALAAARGAAEAVAQAFGPVDVPVAASEDVAAAAAAGQLVRAQVGFARAALRVAETARELEIGRSTAAARCR